VRVEYLTNGIYITENCYDDLEAIYEGHIEMRDSEFIGDRHVIMSSPLFHIATTENVTIDNLFLSTYFTVFDSE